MSRIIVTIFMMAALVVIGYKVNSVRKVDREVVASLSTTTSIGASIPTSNTNFIHYLRRVKGDNINCSGYQWVLDEIQRRFDRRTADDIYEAEGDYASVLAINVMREASGRGDIDKYCLAMVHIAGVWETSMFVLITPSGDFAISYDSPAEYYVAGPAFVPYSEVEVNEWTPDTLAIADYTQGLSSKANDEMQQVPIVKGRS